MPLFYVLHPARTDEPGGFGGKDITCPEKPPDRPGISRPCAMEQTARPRLLDIYLSAVNPVWKGSGQTDFLERCEDREGTLSGIGNIAHRK